MDGSFSLPFPVGIDKNGYPQFKPLNFDVSAYNNKTANEKTGEFILNLSFGLMGNKISTAFTMDDKMINVDIKNENENKNEKYTNSHEEEDEINVVYEKDLNILRIHRKVVSKLKGNNPSKINDMKIKLNNETLKIKTEQTWKEKVESIKLINKLNEDIEILNSNILYDKYINESNTLLQQYKQIGPLEIKIQFGNDIKHDTKHDIPKDKNEELRLSIINNYLNIASKYININVHHHIEKQKIHSCPGCDIILDTNIDINEDGLMVCPKCSVEIPMYSKYIDIDSSLNKNKLSTSQYEERNNFIKRMEEFEGIIPNSYPSNLEQELDKYFISFSMEIGENIRALDYNIDNRTKGNTSKNILYKALKSIGLSELFKYSEWVCYMYWGWKKRDISQYKNKILEDYDLSQPIINKLKNNRKSNMNRNYRLYRHLEKLKYSDLDIRDFRMIKTKDSVKYHDNVWIDNVVLNLGWNNPPINYTPKHMSFG